MAKHLHERRGLSFAELGALLGTRALLASGAMAHTDKAYAEGDKHLFNMDVACRANDHCGSVQCIGGTMARILGSSPDDARHYVVERRYNNSLSGLFFPPGRYGHSSITPKQAVKAIDNFLKTGKPRWGSILRRNQVGED